MDVAVLLCDSTICRLCGEDNDNGTVLFPSEENSENLSELVNRYLPLKVEKDGKFPCTLCPGCTIQLEATRSFFDLIIEGQNKLRELFAAQQDTLRRQEKQKEQLENALKVVNPNTSVQTYTVQTDETGEKFFIQILSEGPLFPPDHELSLRSEGLDKPRKKRGRPPKPLNSPEISDVTETAKDEEVEPEFDVDGKKKRRIKKPLRYSELIQGKELDKLFKEEGVFDDEESSIDGDINLTESNLESSSRKNEVIGHMQGKDGENLGDLILINKGLNKMRSKAKIETRRRKEKFDCEYCGRSFLHQGRLEIHKSFHKNIKYQCAQEGCNISCDTKLALDEHQKQIGHIGTTLVERLENYGQVELPQSEITEIELTPDTSESEKLACTSCSKVFSCKENLDLHIKSSHESEKVPPCEKCDKKIPFLNNSKCTHNSQQSNRTYPCEQCQKVFHHPSSLVYHREAEHNNGRKFVCSKCKKTFKHKQLLLKHQLVHTNERPHICKCCGATFKTRANLINHMPTHTGEKKYNCSQCGQTFAHKTSLTLHVRWHNGQKPYECDICMKTFSQKGNLAEHRRIHTGEKPYCCNFCGRRFTTSSQFKLHVKRHTGERPWKCEYCSKTFLHKDTWKCHMRRHRNERPYQCQQCLRGFTEQWALRKHERLHTGEKPYVCDICKKSFADSSNLTKHKKIHWNTKNKEKHKIENINIIDLQRTNGNEGSDQILYLTYDGANTNDNQSPALVGDELFTDDLLSGCGNEEISLDVQLQQLVDNEGNPINLTTSDGQQIKVVATMIEEDPQIQGLMPDGTLVDLTLQDGKTITSEISSKIENKKEDCTLDETENILDNNIQLLDEENPVIGKLQFLNNSQKINDALQNKIRFLTEDGQNVCFIAAYDIENSGLSDQYIDMQ